MKRCPQCQKTFDKNQKFCSDCGLPLVELPEDMPELLHEELPEDAPELLREELPELLPTEELVPDEVLAAEQPPTAVPPEAEDHPAPAAPPMSPREAKRAEKQRQKAARLQQKEDKQRRKEEKAAERRAPIGAPRRALAVLLCLLLFLLLMSAATVTILRAATTEKGLNAVLDETDLGQLRIDPYFDDVHEEMSLGQLLSEDLENLGVSLNEKDVNKFLRKSSLKSFFAGELGSLFDDIYKGKSRYEFDRGVLAEELMSSDNRELLERMGVELDRETAERVAKRIDGYGLGDMLSRDEIKEEAGALYAGLHYGLSYITLALLLALSLLLIVLLVRTNRGRIGVSLGDVGGVLIAVGAILSLAAVLAQLLPSLWEKLFAGEALLAEISASVLYSQIHVGLIMLGIGILLAVFGRLMRPRRKKGAAAPELPTA